MGTDRSVMLQLAAEEARPGGTVHVTGGDP